jgi:hypothetical protein
MDEHKVQMPRFTRATAAPEARGPGYLGCGTAQAQKLVLEAHDLRSPTEEGVIQTVFILLLRHIWTYLVSAPDTNILTCRFLNRHQAPGNA